VAAVGLTLADLFPAKTDPKAGRNGQPRGGTAAPGGQGGGERGSDSAWATAAAAIEALSRKRGKPSGRWDYRSAEGDLVGVVLRWDTPTGKDIRPLARHADGWRLGAMPEPRPIYRLPELLAADAGVPVVVVEGEKACDAAVSCGLLATTSAGGAQAANKSDWRPLGGRKVIVLPDADAAGETYAATVARLCVAAGAEEVRIVRLREYAPGLPEGGDIADVLTDERWCGLPLGEAATPEDLGRWILAAAENVEPWRPEAAGWPELVPFEDITLPEFPTGALPRALREWVEAESLATQTPPDLAALLALAVCGACIARRVYVEPRPGWREPVNLYVAVLLEPGNRKSAVFTDATAPLREIEAELIARERGPVAIAQSERRQKEARLRKLERLAGEKGDIHAQEEAARLAESLAEENEVFLPRLIVDDSTAEKLGAMLAEQNGRIASLSPEGGVFDLMAGLYSKNGIPQFDIYLKGHSGDDLITDRISRKSVRVTRPALTCAYAMQPQVIRGLADKPAFRGRGLLARFFYSAPKSWIGHRHVAPPPVPDGIREAYRQVVRELAAVPDGEQALRLSAAAEARLREWEGEVERMLGDGGELEAMRDWGGKLCGLTLRVAGILHCAECGPAGEIQAETLDAAIAIARYAVPHAAAALALMAGGATGRDDDARWLWRWVERHGLREFTRRELHQQVKHRFPTVEELEPVLKELESRGYIRPKPTEAIKPGRPPSPAYEVNPAIFNFKDTKNAPQNPQKPTQQDNAPPDLGSFEGFEGTSPGFRNANPAPGPACATAEPAQPPNGQPDAGDSDAGDSCGEPQDVNDLLAEAAEAEDDWGVV
jgi:hypothetical protein